MNKLPNFRTILITVASGVLITLGQRFGLEPIAEWLVAAIGGTYVGGAAIASSNPAKRAESFGVQLQSKKFRTTIVALGVVVLLSIFGVNVPAALAGLAGAYNLFQGYADRFADPKPEPEVLVETKLSQEELNLLAEVRASKESKENSTAVTPPKS